MVAGEGPQRVTKLMADMVGFFLHFSDSGYFMRVGTILKSAVFRERQVGCTSVWAKMHTGISVALLEPGSELL